MGGPTFSKLATPRRTSKQILSERSHLQQTRQFKFRSAALQRSSIVIGRCTSKAMREGCRYVYASFEVVTDIDLNKPILVFLDAPLVLQPADLFGASTADLGASEANADDPTLTPRGWYKHSLDKTKAIGLDESLLLLRDTLKERKFDVRLTTRIHSSISILISVVGCHGLQVCISPILHNSQRFTVVLVRVHAWLLSWPLWYVHCP